MDNPVRLGIYMLDILHMSVKGLFGHLNYDLDFERNDGFSIIAAPNGFGKSTIMKAIDAVFSGNILFFAPLFFQEMDFKIRNGETRQIIDLNIRKKQLCSDVKNGMKYDVDFSFDGKQGSISESLFFSILDEMSNEGSGIRVQKSNVGGVRIYDSLTRESVSISKLYDLFALNMDFQYIVDEKFPWRRDFNRYFCEPIAFISANRFVKSLSIHDYRDMRFSNSSPMKLGGAGRSGIEKINLGQLWKIIQGERERFRNSTLFDESLKIDRGVLSNRDALLNGVHDLLNRSLEIEKRLIRFEIKDEFSCRLSDIQNDLADSTVSLDALQRAYRVLNEFLRTFYGYTEYMDRLELLESTINRMIFFKKIRISAKKSTIISEIDGMMIHENDLSSGESQIITLLGLLLFDGVYDKTPVTVLSDEPEISLHPAWQTELANFFFKCNARYNKRFIFASHSPLFIGNRWDKVINLYKQVKTVNESV